MHNSNVNFNIDDLEDYISRINDFNELTSECIKELDRTCAAILKRYAQHKVPQVILFCFDTIDRIKKNLSFISKAPNPSPNTFIPIGLILRSVFSDLISLTFVVYNIDNTVTLGSFFALKNKEAFNAKYCICENEIKFAKMIKDTVLENYLEDLKITLNNKRQEISNAAKKTDKSNCPNTITDICKYFQNIECLQNFTVLLFLQFKILSQIEHYTIQNRSITTFNKGTAILFQRFALFYNLAISCLCKNIKSHIAQLDT